MLLLLVTVTAFGQLSDQQVINEVRRLQASGASQQQILMELAAKGVTREQGERVIAQYQRLGTATEGTVIETERRTRQAFSERPDFYEPEQKRFYMPPQDTLPSPLQIFGRNLFSTKDLSFEPTMNLPTPENYQLGAGDEVIVDIWGNSELTVRQEISPDGYINVPNIGPIYLQGMDIKEARAKIKGAFSRVYSDLRAEKP